MARKFTGGRVGKGVVRGDALALALVTSAAGTAFLSARSVVARVAAMIVLVAVLWRLAKTGTHSIGVAALTIGAGVGVAGISTQRYLTSGQRTNVVLILWVIAALVVGCVSLFAALRRAFPSIHQDTMDGVQEQLDYELGRARRYGGSVSMIAVETVDDRPLLEGAWERFTFAFSSSLRTVDSFWIRQGTMIVILPHTDSSGRNHVVQRVKRWAEAESLDIRAAASTFPADAPTGDALIQELIESSERLAV